MASAQPSEGGGAMNMAASSGRRTWIGVCIDDFGLHQGINEAALELIASRRVSALSCMTEGPQWRAGAAALRALPPGSADLGLHLNFTESFSPARSPRSLPSLIAAAYSGTLDAGSITAELRVQFDAFEDAIGAPPDFVDGHRHVHQLPVIREALVAEIVRRYGQSRPWLRNTAAPPESRAQAFSNLGWLKRKFITMLGAARLNELARGAGLAQNSRLIGVYGFTGSAGDYEQRLARWLSQARDGDLLMCHPAATLVPDDPIAAARVTEYQVLRGASLPALLELHGVEVVRLSGRLAVGGEAAQSR